MRTLILTAFAVISPALQANTYWVRTNGNDQNPGSFAQPWLTLQHAADVVQAGDTVIAGLGEFQGFNLMDVHGDAANVTVFMSDIATSITTPCDYNDLDGINVEGCEWVKISGFEVYGMPRTGIRTALSDHVTIVGNTCANNGKWGILTGFAEHVLIEFNECSGSIDEHGIYFSNSADDPVIRWNYLHDNNANGIHMNGDVSMGGDGVISNAQVYGNRIRNNGVAGGSGINCDGVVNSVFYNNLLYDNHASGISLYQIDGGAPSTGNRVYNNTIINAADARWCVNITDGCTDNQVINNILINQHAWRGSIVIAADALDGFVSDYNLVTERLSPDGDATILDLADWQALGYDANSQVAEPMNDLFVDVIADDYHPLSNSPQQVDAGTNAVAAYVTTDLDGSPRPIGAGYDIGCYEAALNVGIAQITIATVALSTRTGMVLVRSAPASSTLMLFDAQGRTLRSVQASGDVDVVLPDVPWCMAVLRAEEGRVLATCRVVQP